MKILLTNDDGINAEGLRCLVDFAKTIGEVSVFAPAVEQSAKSQSIEIHNGYLCRKVDIFGGDIEAFAVHSTPADCVRVALLGMEKKFDLVISGINRGFNLGDDIHYSGTVGACFEAARFGVPALALSSYNKSFDNAVMNIGRVFGVIVKNKMFDYAKVINVNFPQVGNEIVVTKMGPAMYGDRFDMALDGTVTPNLVCYYNNTTDISLDTDATMTGHISLTPLVSNLTDERAYTLLSKQPLLF